MPQPAASSPRKRTRRQHVNPQVLLRGFADGGGKVRVRHRDGRSHLASLAQATVVSDFYSHHGQDGQLEDTVERWLGDHVESPAAHALREAQQGRAPAPKDVPAVALFAAAAMLRSWHVRSIIDAFKESAGPDLLVAEQLGRAGFDLSTLPARQRELAIAAARQAWTENTDPREERKSVLRTMQREIDRLATQLRSWTWTVLTSPTPRLVTADVSIATFPQTGTWAGLLPTGHPLYLPVSPWHLLVGEEHPLGPPATDLPAELADVVNQELARWTRDVVITHPDMAWPAGLTLNRTLPTPPAPTIVRTPTTDPDTFPQRYPDVQDPNIRANLDTLGAVDVVE